MPLIEPIRLRRESAEEDFRRVYFGSTDDSCEFELLISDLKQGQISEGILRYVPAELAKFAAACLELHRAEREQMISNETHPR